MNGGQEHVMIIKYDFSNSRLELDNHCSSDHSQRLAWHHVANPICFWDKGFSTPTVA